MARRPNGTVVYDRWMRFIIHHWGTVRHAAAVLGLPGLTNIRRNGATPSFHTFSQMFRVAREQLGHLNAADLFDYLSGGNSLCDVYFPQGEDNAGDVDGDGDPTWDSHRVSSGMAREPNYAAREATMNDKGPSTGHLIR